MGHTLETLAEKQVGDKTIFNNRFCVELCERFHVHYRSLRLNLSKEDFIAVAEGFIKAFERWNARGCPDSEGKHIELCRKIVGNDTLNEGFKVNLNKNLYPEYEGKIFSDGTNFSEAMYIHLKIRDVRHELSIKEFKELADVIIEANSKLTGCDTDSLLQKT